MTTAPRLAFAFSIVIAIAAFRPSVSHADVMINESGQDLTLDCNTDPEIQMNGSGSTLAVTGPCTKIQINGANNTFTIAEVEKLMINGATNTVMVDAVDKIMVSGTANTVTYKKPLKAKKTKVARTGLKNTIKKIK